MTFSPDLSDARSRVRFAVGDTAAAELFPDATYDAQLALTTSGRQSVTCTAVDNTFRAPSHGLANGTAVLLANLTAAIGISAGAIRYVRDATADTFALALTPTGAAIDLSADGAGLIGVVDEAAATREIARGLAAVYAQQPDSLSDAGSSISWKDRVAQWNRIAAGTGGGATSSRAKGITFRRGPARDYTTGDGDA